MRLRTRQFHFHPRQRPPGTCAALLLVIMTLVFLNPCLLYCVVMQHTMGSELHDQSSLSPFLCQLASVPLPHDQQLPDMHHHQADSGPFNESASILRAAYEYMPHTLIGIVLPPLLLAFLGIQPPLGHTSIAATPPTPPPRQIG